MPKLMMPLLFYLAVFASLYYSPALFADGWNAITRAPNTESISYTRHNLTMSYLSPIAGGGSIMDNARNNYLEICVYCHTPHGASGRIAAPLWNRTINTSTYAVYDKPRTLNQPISQPGPNSLTCLSCHDGTIAIDSIINMPGSGGFNPAQAVAMDVSFLNSWNSPAAVHATLGNTPGSDQQCTYCHSQGGGAQGFPFEVFIIGEDLTNDHPVGVLYPESLAPEIDFYEPSLIYTNRSGAVMKVFDTNGNRFPDTDEVRLYNSGEGAEVECASCHDPHGVASGDAGSKFNPSFLRVNNGVVSNHAGAIGVVSDQPSALCLTCHIK